MSFEKGTAAVCTFACVNKDTTTTTIVYVLLCLCSFAKLTRHLSTNENVFDGNILCTGTMSIRYHVNCVGMYSTLKSWNWKACKKKYTEINYACDNDNGESTDREVSKNPNAIISGNGNGNTVKRVQTIVAGNSFFFFLPSILYNFNFQLVFMQPIFCL